MYSYVLYIVFLPQIAKVNTFLATDYKIIQNIKIQGYTSIIKRTAHF